MNFSQLTDSDIHSLVSMPKRVTNPAARWTTYPGHRQKNYAVQGGDLLFNLYLRQSDLHQNNFSCGLWLLKPDGEKLTLLRYNGSSHPHGDIHFKCHVHKATEAAISKGKKPEHYATETDEYHSLNGALFCICQDANISGLRDLKPDEPDLFK